MALAGRNDPCPCGSGRKYKKCCGYDRATERALEDNAFAMEQIAELAFGSPRLLPDCDAFDDWVRGILADEFEADMHEAVATLEDGEAARILTACLEIRAEEWSELAARCGSPRDAVSALLAGSIAAGIRDLRPPSRQLVEVAEPSQGMSKDPIEALGICLHGEQLWEEEDGFEAARAVDAIPEWVDDEKYEQLWYAALDTVAARNATDWHRRRLTRLVGRVERWLPFEGLPQASAAIAAGCAMFAADDRARMRLAAMLLSDLLVPQPPRITQAPLFAA